MLDFGSKSVYLKFGEYGGKSLDIFYDGKEILPLNTKRIKTDDTHGSGCSLSSAIASNLANGKDLKNSVICAKNYVFDAIEKSFKIGQGFNPINHFYQFY